MESDLNESNKKLDKAVAQCRLALDLCPVGSPSRSRVLTEVANALRNRCGQLGEIEDLEEAIACDRQALDLHPPGHPNRPESLNKLGIDVCVRFERRGKVEDLKEGVTRHRQALDLRSPGHPDRSISLNNLAITLCIRFIHWGLVEDLEEAITYNCQALDLRPPGHPDHSAALNNLANTLFLRFSQQGQIEDLEEAIVCHREVLDILPPSHPDRSGSLNNLANTVHTRFKQRGQVGDLEEAITCHREVLDLCPPGHPGHSASLNNLANAVHNRFMQWGQVEDLEEAIARHRQALDFCPPGHPSRSASLNSLANAVHNRFMQWGQVEDLEEAIACHRQALDLRPPGHPDRSTSLTNLANIMSTRFSQRGQIQDLEEAIAFGEQSFDLCPPGHLDRSLSLANLAKIMSTRFSQQGQIQDLEEAITYGQQSLDLCPLGHLNRSECLKNLASALSSRFRRLGRMADLDKAIKYLVDAEDTLPIPHPLHAELRSHLATAYLLQYESHPQPGDLPQAFRLFESGANHSTATLKDRFDVALEWAQGARRHQHYSILQAYSISLTLLDRRLNITLDIESQHHLLATTSSIPRSLASDAASCAIAAGQLESAVELLEQGRGILWSKLRGYRHPLERLRNIDRQLAAHFEALSGQLEHHTIMSTRSDPAGQYEAGLGVAAFEAKMHQHRILSKEWDDVVERIRRVEGFANFLQAVPFSTLRLAAAEGPVIIVNISQYRSDAIILHGMDSPVLVPLPNASPEDLALLSSQLSAARTNRSLSIRQLLRRLWDIIVFPVRDKLAALGVAERSRIWWCPTSELCALPLHAAGPYKHGAKNLPDIYISSYTPTLSTLIRARSGIVNRPGPPDLLVMGQPGENLEVGTLENVKEEIRRIHSFGDFVDVLVAGDANRQTVLPDLQEHNWIHFACHGHQALQPFQSSFELHDEEQLTLMDLIKARLPNAEFAFLSACHSAAADTGNTPDEAISLAAAVQFCGFRSVVGTLWAMADIDGPDIAEDFYGYMFRDLGSVDFRDSAKALNLATRAMRKRKRMTIDRWINFVHIGA